MDSGHWCYPIEFDVNEWFGFVYRIINNQTNQHYIGKKQFHSTSRKRIVGRKNRKVVTKESNWKEYTSSSEYVNEDILVFGKASFTFLIESLHATKSSLHYAEVEAQIFEDVLRSTNEDGSKKFYNKAVGAIKFIPPHIDDTEFDHKMKLVSYGMRHNARNKFYINADSETTNEWQSLFTDGDSAMYAKLHTICEPTPTHGECPHCGKSGKLTSLQRFHFEKCKKKLK